MSIFIDTKIPLIILMKRDKGSSINDVKGVEYRFFVAFVIDSVTMGGERDK
jgi:hypothetical protein